MTVIPAFLGTCSHVDGALLAVKRHTDLVRLAEEPVQFCSPRCVSHNRLPFRAAYPSSGRRGSLPLWYLWGSRELITYKLCVCENCYETWTVESESIAILVSVYLCHCGAITTVIVMVVVIVVTIFVSLLVIRVVICCWRCFVVVVCLCGGTRDGGQ